MLLKMKEEEEKEDNERAVILKQSEEVLQALETLEIGSKRKNREFIDTEEKKKLDDTPNEPVRKQKW